MIIEKIMKERIIKKVIDFIRLVKTELAICIAVPILTAVLLNTDHSPHQSYLPLLIIALFCAFVYGIIKMFFTLNKRGFIKPG